MMMLYYPLLLYLLTSVTSTLEVEYDNEELQPLELSTTNVDIDELPAWLEEDDESEISVSDQSICPPPPPSESKTEELCNKTICTNNVNCSSSNENVTLICCFNGCVQTCMLPVDPPIAFDWVDESPSIKQISVPENTQSAHSSAPELMAIRGGCLLTPTQLSSLQMFKENQHVKDCFCDIGNVFCKISER